MQSGVKTNVALWCWISSDTVCPEGPCSAACVKTYSEYEKIMEHTEYVISIYKFSISNIFQYRKYANGIQYAKNMNPPTAYAPSCFSMTDMQNMIKNMQNMDPPVFIYKIEK